MNKPNYYAILPSTIRYDENLKPNVKLLYAEITALCNMNGECFASNRYFAELYGKSKGTISGWVSDLVKAGYVKIEYTYKKDSRQIEHRYIRIIAGAIPEKLNDLYDKSLKSNNTSINNKLTVSNKKRFKKPTLEEVNLYCKERNNNVSAETFINFYESKDWYVGKNKMKSWKAAVRNWESRDKSKQTMSKIDKQLNQYLDGKKYL
jgi:hypothetical protein|tara:strand:- start:257 stop:874 length:618 start_codon:yes stop_codon:yes gene_type:complete